MKKYKQNLWGKIFQLIIKGVVYFLYHPKVRYTDKTLKKRLKKMPCVFVANHTHHHDGAFCGAVLGRYKPWVLVKRSWYEKKGIGTMIKWLRTIPINLDEADGEWFEISEQIVNDGGSLMIFPEGGLAREGVLQPFKAGAGLVSAKTGAAVVPCAIYGTYPRVFGKRQKILIGEPIESICPENMRRSKFARSLMETSREKVAELYAVLEKEYGKNEQYLPKPQEEA